MRIVFLLIGITCYTSSVFAQLQLWYKEPTKQWEETLPLGNGRLGMMPDGGVAAEKLVLNDITLWSGAPQDANNKEAYKKLPEIQRLLLEGKNDEAQALIDKDFICTGKGSGAEPYGCFQTMGSLTIQTGHQNVQNYKRILSLDSAVAGCVYDVNGVRYKREYFTSFGDDVGVVKLSASKRGMLNLSISLARAEKGTVTVEGNELNMYGQLENGYDGKGMEYSAKVGVRLQGGKLSTEKNTLVVKDADEVIIIFSAKTSFKDKLFRQHAAQLLQKALTTPYETQKKKHITNYRKLFARQTIYLGPGNNINLSTPERLNKFQTVKPNDLPIIIHIQQ